MNAAFANKCNMTYNHVEFFTRRIDKKAVVCS